MNAVVLSPLAVVAADPDLAELLAVAAALPPCRADCGRLAERQRGGLCRRCSRDPAVRARFPASVHARRGAGLGCRGYRLPDAPTAARPGSPAKVAVLEERAAQGVALWHPDDAR